MLIHILGTTLDAAHAQQPIARHGSSPKHSSRVLALPLSRWSLSSSSPCPSPTLLLYPSVVLRFSTLPLPLSISPCLPSSFSPSLPTPSPSLPLSLHPHLPRCRRLPGNLKVLLTQSLRGAYTELTHFVPKYLHFAYASLRKTLRNLTHVQRKH